MTEQDEIKHLHKLLIKNRYNAHYYTEKLAELGPYAAAHIQRKAEKAKNAIVEIEAKLQSLGIEVNEQFINQYTEEARLEREQNKSSKLSEKDKSNRQTLIKSIKRLSQELPNNIIHLSLTEDQEAVIQPGEIQHPHALLQATINQSDETVIYHSQIIDVYNNSNGQLLILGAPGAGKSLLLNKLALDLITRDKNNNTKPVPIIFSLATWKPQQSLLHWMISDLAERYKTKPQYFEHLFALKMILPLLDGLDEVATFELQQQCVMAINNYRQEDFETFLVVTCREREYQNLPKLMLNTAFVIQPLTLPQINTYLDNAQLSKLQEAINHNNALAALANTPLFLYLLSTLYNNNDQGQKEIHLLPIDNDAHLLHQTVLDAYVEVCSQKPKIQANYKVSINTLRAFLVWLAQNMRAHHNQQIFFIEFLQPTWLPSKTWLHIWSYLFGGLGALLFIVPTISQLSVIQIISIAVGLCFFFGFFGTKKPITVAKTWVWNAKIFVHNLRNHLIIGISLFTLSGIAIALIDQDLSTLVLGPCLGLVFGLCTSLLSGFEDNILTESLTPNQGMQLSIRNAIQKGIILSVFAVIVLSLLSSLLFGWNIGIILGTVSGIIAGFIAGFVGFGGITLTQHYLLRLFLAFTTPAPLNLVPWLEEACRRGFLVRVGGGYRFYHELLQQHFASYQEPGFPRVPILAEDHPELLEENS